MSRQRRALVDAVYASFALQQPLTLQELAEGAPRYELQMTHTQTPLWFAAAVHEPNLMKTAPELMGIPEEMESEEWAGLAGTDLVHLYAPELDSHVATPVRQPIVRREPPPAPRPEPVRESAPPAPAPVAASVPTPAPSGPDAATADEPTPSAPDPHLEMARLLEELSGIEE